MTQDLIRYDLLVQDALKGVVRKVLADAAREGLPGEHHFYVSFQTTFPGVRLSSRMREKYPDTMTIVLQHQFWDLAITEHSFEVGLSFGGVPERLLVPFDALTGFFDPSVQFGLKFEIRDAEPAPVPAAGPVAVETPRQPARGAGSEPAETEPRRAPATTPRIPASRRSAEGAEGAEGADEARAKKGAGKPSLEKKKSGETEPAKDGEGAGGAETPSGAEVVSLDAFRKKT
ncbi:SspB family protein [Salinarimonas rosea]|uniref:SspB family protein n=1 Tax=Salinarimonas rosea TaxID=552063 RepID=UPI0003FD698C|nr:ClpXP protease specificity-enhancing factor SspB [Salinarimonas rosea]